jgi:serine/threonine protein kinase
MLFNKYQYNQFGINKRGYSQSSLAYNEEGKEFWVKWMLGIEKNDTKAKILADKLRHLQKARHSALPEIIEYGYDEEQNAFAIVYELLEEVETFETKVFELKTQGAISGLLDIADCLKELHLKFKINHGDIHPANILIDKNGQFYLVDFGLADITKTLSQTKELEIQKLWEEKDVYHKNIAQRDKANAFILPKLKVILEDLEKQFENL